MDSFKLGRYGLLLAVLLAFPLIFAGSLQAQTETVLYKPLARMSNYPGVFAARWVQYRGIAPSAGIVLAFNIWLVLTSGLEWIVVGLVVRSTICLRSRSGQ
jgi:hypothetical protein